MSIPSRRPSPLFSKRTSLSFTTDLTNKMDQCLLTTVNDTIPSKPLPIKTISDQQTPKTTTPELFDSAYETGTDSEVSSNDDSPPSPPTTLPQLAKAKGHYWITTTGAKILDACGGAGVACIGHGRKEVIKAITKQMASCSYASYAHFKLDPVERLSEWLVESTGGMMKKVYLMCSGSEAIEAALKLSLEFHHSWTGGSTTKRTNFITRTPSYHGTTLGSLSASNHFSRRLPFISSGILLESHFHPISACNPYRDQLFSSVDEPTAAYVSRKLAELESMFLRLGPETVAAVIMEPIVGAALGCVPPPPGYMRGVKKLCERYGALLVFDEVMCGMGRSGTLHAWQSIERPENGEEGGEVVPDLQTLGKCFTGGYTPGSALLVGHKIAGVMEQEKRVFTHGHTYQNNPLVAAAALAVQVGVIEREGLLAKVREHEKVLGWLLRQRLSKHPNVGDIRGRGLFWGVEFVKDRETKEPFDVGLGVAQMVHRTAMKEFGVLVYNGQGCAGEGRGDHVMVMPAYDILEEELEMIVDRLGKAVESVFEKLGGI
ncbi:pyridoxal phosphate-dependent transferase [Neurospora tetraspora]|uniref:Pyridoxal phosphate-dependent transferase n=1 Tax=Neurospora tetraspora TaxID=94610 RepID=A0AAE0JAA1_9PEZI|nr:pyridoxal phosphate-dependent transferase [Neurospora tetraspora]